MAIWIILQSSINGRFPINVKKKEGIYQEMRELGWSPGTQLFLNDVNILTNFGDLETAIIAYQKRFDIEEMFQDFKSGGYSLEGS